MVKKHTIDTITAYVNEDTGDNVKNAIKYIVNYMRLNINIKTAFCDLEICKLWDNVDTSGEKNMLLFGETPRQVFYFEKNGDYDNVIRLNCERLFNSLNEIWNYCIKNKKMINDGGFKKMSFYFEISEQLNSKNKSSEKHKLMSNYILTYSYNNWLFGSGFNTFIKRNNLERGMLLCDKKISENTINWGWGLETKTYPFESEEGEDKCVEMIYEDLSLKNESKGECLISMTKPK